jgi:hypothetical protein
MADTTIARLCKYVQFFACKIRARSGAFFSRSCRAVTISSCAGLTAAHHSEGMQTIDGFVLAKHKVGSGWVRFGKRARQ